MLRFLRCLVAVATMPRSTKPIRPMLPSLVRREPRNLFGAFALRRGAPDPCTLGRHVGEDQSRLSVQPLAGARPRRRCGAHLARDDVAQCRDVLTLSIAVAERTLGAMKIDVRTAIRRLRTTSASSCVIAAASESGTRCRVGSAPAAPQGNQTRSRGRLVDP